MKKSLIALAAMSVVAACFDPVRARTHDNNSFSYRMGAGFAGDVNRTHPASIYPGIQDSTTPVRRYGEGALLDTTHNAWRGLKAADGSDSVPIILNGVLVRDYPVQAATAAGNFGQQTLSDSVSAPSSGVVLSWLMSGRIIVKVRGASPTALNINSPVYIFTAVDESGHVQGGFETAAITGKTVQVINARYRGPSDANGITELDLWQEADQQ